MIRTQITLGIILMIATIATLGYTFATEDARMVVEEELQVARRIENGAQLFHTACASCHGEMAQGIPGLCPPLNSATLLEQRVEETGWAGTVHDYIVNTVRGGRLVSTRPEQYAGQASQGMAMPFWGQDYGGPLRNDQIEDIALYLLNYGETDIDIASGPTPTPIPQDDMEVLIAAGIEVYKANGCGGCHTLNVAESMGATCPTHEGMGAIAGQRIEEAGYGGASTDAEEYIRESIVNPGVYLVEGYANIMPAYSSLPDDQLNALVQLLLQQQ